MMLVYWVMGVWNFGLIDEYMKMVQYCVAVDCY